MNFFTKMLQGLRTAAQKIITVFFVKIRDPQTGRLPISNSTIKVVFSVIGASFFIFVVVSNLMSTQKSGNDLNDYEKEVRNDRGMATRQVEVGDLFKDDGLDISAPREDVLTSNAPEANAATSVECFALIQKLKDGEINLPLQDKKRLDECLANNTSGLSSSDLAMAKALNDKTLTPEQRKILVEQWSTGTEGKKMPGLELISSALKEESANKATEALKASGIPVAKDSIIDLAQVVKSSGNALAEKALKNAFEAKPLSQKEKSALSEVAKGITPKDNTESSTKSGFFGGSSSPNKETEIKEITERIRSKQAELDNLRSDLAESQAQAREAAKKMADGKALTTEEAQAVKASAEKSEKVQSLKNEIEADRASVQSSINDLSQLISDANAVTRSLPTSVGEFYVDREGKKVRRRKKDTVAKPPTKEEIEYTIKQKEMVKVREFKDSLLGGVAVEGKLLNQYAFGPEPMQIEKLSVSFTEKEALHLSSNAKYLASLESEILFPSNEKAQQFRVRLNSDVYDAETQKIAIPKGTIMVGSISGFNEETGVADIVLTKARVGKKVHEFSIRVASANGTIGLRGDVYDHRGRKLVAALVTSFTGGALGWFSQNVIAQYQNSPNAAAALQGSAMNGASEVVNKISNMLAADLNNTPSVFFAPKGTPLILLPDDQ